MSQHSSRSRWLSLAGIVASALLLGLYARGGLAWPLGFVALVPWLLAMNRLRAASAALVSGLLFSVAFALSVFTWFGAAVGSFTGIGTPAAMLVLCLLAPLLQPQLWLFALVRHQVGQHHGPALGALAGASVWVACEWLLPKLLGDTLGHGLAPALHMRQVADLGGAAGITFLLLLVNEAVALAVTRWRGGARALWPPLLLAAAVPLLMLGYGSFRLAELQAMSAAPAASIRIGAVQTSIVDYEGLRRELGTYGVVRQVLDTHFGLSRAAIEHHGVDALLWSETVYPTTFGQARSEDGAALDREILDFANESGVSLVFGTYDLDANGEYNAAAFVEPQSGLLGFYRKTHPFPLTEHVPGWLDSELFRRWLPWTGTWQPGAGARVFPLRTTDGRVLQVLPLICLDDVGPDLAIEGARLGAQAIVGLSNDAWFSVDPMGARLHLAVASFRSIETRLPQLRVTSNGFSAFIDPSGEVVASTAIGDRAVLAGALPIQDPQPTLMVRWGDWFGGACLILLLILSVTSVANTLSKRRANWTSEQATVRRTDAMAYSADVVLLSPLWRAAAAGLRMIAALGLLTVFLQMLLGDGLQVNALSQIRLYIWAVLVPAGIGWAIQRVFAGRLWFEPGQMVLQTPLERTEIALGSIAALHAWRLPLPKAGVDIEFASGRRWRRRIVLSDAPALLRALNAAGASVRLVNAGAADYARVRSAAARPWLDHPIVKFVVFPLVPALPAFRLHQHIAFGGTFGEYYTYGLQAWLLGLLIWWSAWSIGLMLFAALLRIGSEACTLLALRWRPMQAAIVRNRIEWLLRLLFFLGVPVWLLLRIVAG